MCMLFLFMCHHYYYYQSQMGSFYICILLSSARDYLIYGQYLFEILKMRLKD